jgi:polysaccharide export outer membrane protein
MALKEKLEQDLQPYLRDAIVTVGFANHFVTIMGEVGSPKKINLNNEQFTLLDVLTESGKGTPDVNMNNLMVIREKSGSRNFKTLNLEDPSVFNSEYYLMQPGDIVVVKPNEKKMMTEEKRMRAQQITTLSLQVVTIGLVLYNTFFRN